MPFPHKLVSGGQTGVDRAALDAALACGVRHGGWCPRGRRAEDGRIDDVLYHGLVETEESADYSVRTERNVVDSDGTLILCLGEDAFLTGGTLWTRQCAEAHRKPCLVLDLRQQQYAVLNEWLQEYKIAVLNIAGPRESQSPGIAAAAKLWLVEWLQSSTS